MLTTLDADSETGGDTSANESGDDGQGHGEGTASGFGCQRAPSPYGRWRLIRLCATLFACGAGDGNRTRAVSLGIRHGSVHCAQVTTSDVLANDLS